MAFSISRYRTGELLRLHLAKAPGVSEWLSEPSTGCLLDGSGARGEKANPRSGGHFGCMRDVDSPSPESREDNIKIQLGLLDCFFELHGKPFPACITRGGSGERG